MAFSLIKKFLQNFHNHILMDEDADLCVCDRVFNKLLNFAGSIILFQTLTSRFKDKI